MSQNSSAWQDLYHILSATWNPDGLAPAGHIAWPDVVGLALSSGAGPLLHSVVQSTGLSIARELKERLAQTYYATAAENAIQFRKTEDLLAGLAARDVPVLLLKGAALAPCLYENIALRPIGDTDLVVPLQQVDRASETLAALDYEPIWAELAPGTSQAYRSALAFAVSSQSWVQMELHWYLLDVPYYFEKVPMDWFWQNTEMCTIARHDVHVLNHEANLIYLPAHLALHHRLHGLRWLMDLALLLYKNQDTINWEKVISAAQEFELLLALRETLDRLANYWPCLPLNEIRQRLHTIQPTRFETKLFRLLTAEPRKPFLDFYTDIVCLPDIKARAQFILSNLFPQTAYMSERYGINRAWELPFWYLYRLGDGLVKTARTVPQVLRLG